MTDQDKTSKESGGKNGEGSIWAGIGIGMGIYLVIYLIASIIQLETLLFFVGPIVHLITMIVFLAIGKRFTGIGLLILAGIILLLVSACFGFVIFSLNNG
ncbi:hypothetical protein AN964_10660 [Heyndrickxia shackletonii]|uniref:Uncharacterized protein n=1 Tax=Heyndrickxia shackletonii TaxID=157838 RepID=A0A0Q3WWS6_9BACI|nr:hypothetical protein [Heyndrickxia shackletonii]KQL53914.1 hypothetical protein AN964_10660 [Heyndrickxia shackletonii]MBB2478924.1 hypothetical protein [Bacillus sp. APMAM]NEY97807.1 hypothetical protein [Heyndrickxia shackletonii]RTZ57668.1 hypothetical protein EKO25_01750 [Bacillus sp. SAJ1]